MKALIINSPLFREKNSLYDEDSLPPIGLGYIATVLQNNDIDVKLIDAVFQQIPLVDLISIVNSLRPGFIASNIFTTNYELVKEFAEGISFETHFIIGGLSTKQLYKDILTWETNNPIDIVTGDGELITLDIIKGDVKDIPFIIKDNRRVFAIDGTSRYLVKNISNVPLDRSFFQNEPVSHPLGFLESNIITSRGCVYNCTFCAAARSLNKDYPVREKSEESIIEELRAIQHNNPNVNSIRVLDDLFLKGSATVQKAINIFSKFDFHWRAMAHVLTFNEIDSDMMGQLKKTRCFELFIGIESGSSRILRSINKTHNIDLILTNLSKVLRAGINIKGYFIYGFPGETKEDMDKTYALASQLKELSIKNGVNFRTSTFQYRPYHGTQIYHDLESQGHSLLVEQIAPNPSLSALVGRVQFNFHSGNFSDVDNQTLLDYIYRTMNLNGKEIFASLSPNINQSMQE